MPGGVFREVDLSRLELGGLRRHPIHLLATGPTPMGRIRPTGMEFRRSCNRLMPGPASSITMVADQCCWVRAMTFRRRLGCSSRPPKQVEEIDVVLFSSEGALIVFPEATPVSIRGNGYAGAPGIYSDTQIVGWRRVTDAVHAKGGRIFQQLWHVGSAVGCRPAAERRSAGRALLRLRPRATPTPSTAKPPSMPRALELHEIPGIIEEFRAGSAERALRASFDGVEIHGANGYLPDQFLQDGTNKRRDEYGGPIENRARFLLEVTQPAFSSWGCADRVGVRDLAERRLLIHVGQRSTRNLRLRGDGAGSPGHRLPPRRRAAH